MSRLARGVATGPEAAKQIRRSTSKGIQEKMARPAIRLNVMKPTVSVLMPVFNGEQFLRPAMNSILNQTFTDFEFIIVDDGSTDHSREILNSYTDSRVRLICNESNIGLTDSLNRGLEAASGNYIARMDQDDISLPERLAKQVAFMDSHPEVGACGTWARDIDQTGKIIADRPRLTGERLDCYYWIPSPVIHPSTMMRSDLAGRLRYDNTVGHVEDFDLWLRIVKAGYKLHNLAEYLFLYRVHQKSMSYSILEKQLHLSYECLCRHVSPHKMSYEAFLSFFQGSYDLGPLRRTFILLSLGRALRKPCRVFLRDSLGYTKMWLQITLYNAVSTLPGFSIIRKMRRQIRLVTSGVSGDKQSI